MSQLPGKIGLENGTVRLFPHSKEWEAFYDRERDGLLAVLGDHILTIQHIGSTAIPDMPAKPIIDIAASVESEDRVPSCIQPLASLGYEYKGEYGLPGRHFFVKGNPHTHYLHVVSSSSAHWRSWLLFRDYLTSTPALAAEYAELKQRLALQHSSDRNAYTKAKGTFIERALREAEENWRDSYIEPSADPQQQD